MGSGERRTPGEQHGFEGSLTPRSAASLIDCRVWRTTPPISPAAPAFPCPALPCPGWPPSHGTVGSMSLARVDVLSGGALLATARALDSRLPTPDSPLPTLDSRLSTLERRPSHPPCTCAFQATRGFLPAREESSTSLLWLKTAWCLPWPYARATGSVMLGRTLLCCAYVLIAFQVTRGVRG